MKTHTRVAGSLGGFVSSRADMMHSELVFAGTRLPAANLLDQTADGDTIAQLLKDFPSVTEEQVTGVLHRLSPPVQ